MPGSMPVVSTKSPAGEDRGFGSWVPLLRLQWKMLTENSGILSKDNRMFLILNLNLFEHWKPGCMVSCTTVQGQKRCAKNTQPVLRQGRNILTALKIVSVYCDKIWNLQNLSIYTVLRLGRNILTALKIMSGYCDKIWNHHNLSIYTILRLGRNILTALKILSGYCDKIWNHHNLSIYTILRGYLHIRAWQKK